MNGVSSLGIVAHLHKPLMPQKYQLQKMLKFLALLTYQEKQLQFHPQMKTDRLQNYKLQMQEETGPG